LKGLDVDSDYRSLRHNGDEVVFTPREYQLFSFLLRHPFAAYPAHRLLAEAWNQPNLSPEQVRLYVAQIRKKLVGIGAPVELITQPRKGYMCVIP
jgi:DNA-binding response OmpR family regulator